MVPLLLYYFLIFLSEEFINYIPAINVVYIKALLNERL
jgi:hypothetical protein